MIGLAVPSLDDVKADFWLSWSTFVVEASKNHALAVLNCRTSLITNSRYQLVKEALVRGCGHVLFVDSDLTFPPDALDRLLGHRMAIVGATYARRREPYDVLGYGVEDIPPGATGLHPMARLPAGMMLIDASVFATVPRPWFIDRWRDEEEDFISEDFAFCDSARAAGYDIYCDLDLSHELGHVGQQVFTWGLSSESKPKE